MESICTLCRRPKAAFECGSCQKSVCKKCAQVVREDSFSFLDKIPADIVHRTYCGVCFDAQVAPALEAYQHEMKRAREVIVYFRHQNEESRLIKRSEKPIVVSDCADRDETLLRLA